MLGCLNDSKKLRFVLKPLKNTVRASENILSAVCDTWMHLAWNLAGHLSSRFSEVNFISSFDEHRIACRV